MFFQGSKTLDVKMCEAGLRPSGFDYMRVFLAVCIVLFHSFEISYGISSLSQPFEHVFRPFVALLLPTFFCLSGFLIAGSSERSRNLFVFISYRILRIFPALIVEVVLSALILGAFFTTLSLYEYFTHPDFYAYFYNIIGFIHYFLPGVYQENPVQYVNAQLWTVPFELFCYMFFVVLFLLRLMGRHSLLFVIVFLLICQVYIEYLQFNSRVYCVPGFTLIVSFLVGVLFYRYKSFIPWRLDLFALSFLSAILCLSFRGLPEIFSPLFIGYICVFVGVLNPPKNKIILSGDYSYGIFLYGYVVQQAVTSLFDLREWYLNFLISLPVIVLFSVFSWWCIEKPVLSLKKHIR